MPWAWDPWALQFLKEMVLQKFPNFIFLCETICRQSVVERVRTALGFEGMIVVDASGIAEEQLFFGEIKMRLLYIRIVKITLMSSFHRKTVQSID